jgi:adenine C2-methylase RlmN of 23S rRNA A2503 and tRNA A37
MRQNTIKRVKNMNKKENLLLSMFLKESRKKIGSHECNDTPNEYYAGWTEEEIKEFNHKLNEYNGYQTLFRCYLFENGCSSQFIRKGE